MIKKVWPVFFLMLCSSCATILESIGERLHRDKTAWMDTGDMTLYYSGSAGLSHIVIYPGKKGGSRYEIFADTLAIQPRRYTTINLALLKDSLYNNDISIWVFEKNTHYRDHMVIYLDPDKWKKKRVYSLHYYH